MSDEATAVAHLCDLKETLVYRGIYDRGQNRFVKGKERNLLWLDEMGQHLDYVTYSASQVVGLAGVPAKAKSGHNRETMSYDGAFGGDLWIYEPHTLYAQAEFTTDLAPPELRETRDGLTSVTPKGCQVGATFLSRIINLVAQMRARDIMGDIVFVTDGHASRFYAPLLKWFADSKTADPDCVIGHDIFLTPPNATGNLCVLDQVFQKLHAGYVSMAREVRGDDLGLPLGRYECQQTIARLHTKGWCTLEERRHAWRKCGFEMRGDLGEESCMGVAFMKDASTRLVLPDGRISWACFVIGDSIKQKKKNAAAEKDLLKSGKAVQLVVPQSSSGSASVNTHESEAPCSPSVTTSVNTPGVTIVYPSPDPKLFAEGTMEYMEEKVRLTQVAWVQEKQKVMVSPSPKEGGVFQNFKRKSATIPAGPAKVPRPHGSLMTKRNGDFVEEAVAINDAKEAKEREKEEKLAEREALYIKCATQDGCKCDGVKCVVAGWYKCPFCLVIKKSKCGVADCVKKYVAKNSQAQPLPNKVIAVVSVVAETPKGKRKVSRKAAADDPEDSEDEEADEEWVYDIGENVELLYRGEYEGYFPGTVTKQKVQGGKSAYCVQHDDGSYCWAYPHKDDIRGVSSTEEPAAVNIDKAKPHYWSSEEDDDVPLALRGAASEAS